MKEAAISDPPRLAILDEVQKTKQSRSGDGT